MLHSDWCSEGVDSKQAQSGVGPTPHSHIQLQVKKNIIQHYSTDGEKNISSIISALFITFPTTIFYL
jgi:hypothetical protein